MRAVVVERFAPLAAARMGELPEPQPGPGEVLIRVHAAEANYPDILVIEGAYQVKPPLPFAPGKAAAGVVEATGAGVDAFAAGDRVAAQVEYGAYAEKLVAPAASCFRMPDAMPFVDGAALGLVYQTAHFALRERASFARGEVVLVLGASGGIGTAAVQLAKAFGARLVIGGVLGADNAAVARAAGADLTVDLGAGDLRDSLRAAVHDATDGHGADIVIDPVGGAANAAALRALAWRGRMVIIGFASGEIPTIKANYLLVKNIAVSGLQWSDYRDRDPAWVRRAQDEIYALYLDGKVKPRIGGTFPLARFAEALELLRAGKAQGKLVLTLDG
ncbi:MAG TPA: NADPH:quinone oxidoreductase family protein [Alphaproteobacteria bacterium]